MHNPKEVHLHAVYRIFHYLNGSVGKGILFQKSDRLTVKAYKDADYGSSLIDRKSTTGYCGSKIEHRIRVLGNGRWSLWIVMVENHPGRLENQVGRTYETLL